MPIDLLLKEEIGSQAFDLRRVDVTGAVEECKPACRRLAIVIPNGKPHRNRRANSEQDRQFSPEAQVLSSLAGIEPDDRFALSCFTGVNQRQCILDLQAAQVSGHGWRRKHFDLKKTIIPIDILVLTQMLLPFSLHAELGDTGIDRARLRTGDPERQSGRALIDDFDQEGSEAALLKNCRRRPARNFDSNFRIQMNGKQNLPIQQLLNLSGVPSPTAACRALLSLAGKRSSQQAPKLESNARRWTPTVVPQRRSAPDSPPLFVGQPRCREGIPKTRTTASNAVVLRRTQYLFIILHLVAYERILVFLGPVGCVALFDAPPPADDLVR